MEELEDLFDTSQYCTLEGHMLIPTITPESATDCDDFYQSNHETSSLTFSDQALEPKPNNHNLYGHEFVDSAEIRDNKPGNYLSDYGYNIPPQNIVRQSEPNGAIFSSWKASSTPNPIPLPQIDPNMGLPRKICSNCGSISTPSWRRCPEGRNLLCNACGLYQKLHNRPRPLRIREDGSVQVIRNTNSMNRNVCQNCKTTDTPIWRRSQDDRNLLLCNACALYLKNHNSLRPQNYNYTDEKDIMNCNWIEVKKDWVYQRKKTFVFKSWNPRYMVLYSRPCPSLALYEQRSDSVPPYAPIMHLELTSNLRIEPYGKSSLGSHQDSMTSMAASRHAEDAASEARRGSITSLVSELRGGKSKKNMEESAFVITRAISENQAPLKLVIALGSVEERDDWVYKMKLLIESLLVSHNSMQSVIADEPALPAESKSIRPVASTTRNGLTCLGVTIVKESKLSKLQENQPILLSNSNSESDSLLNEIVLNVQQKCKLVENVFPEEFIAKYYQNLKILKSSEVQAECFRNDLQLYRILATFNDDVCKYVRVIIDEYHRKVPVNSSALYEFGPIRISLLPGYNQNDDTIIEYSNTVNRQELHAVRWINGSRSADVNTMIVTCVEYKGFRFSAFIDVPLGSNTLSLDLCPSEEKPILIKEEHLDELNNIGVAMKLALNNHVRLADNRTVTLSLPPNVELHHLPRNIAGYPKGPYILNMSQVPPSWPINPDNSLLCGLYRFRPEFLENYPVTLSTSDFNAEKSLTAFKYLIEDHLNAVLEKLESLEFIPIDSLEWTEWLHSQGVNCVLMGKLASKTRLPHIREHLMIEMIARTAKRAIQAQLRGSILHFKEVQALKVEEELRAIVLHTLATIVGNTSNDMMGYVIELLEAVKYKFDFRIDLDTFRHLPRAAIFLAIQHHSGLQFVDRVYDFNLEAPFAKEDFLMFVPTIDNGPLPSGPANSCYNALYQRELNESTSNHSSIEDALTETEALYRLGQQVLPLGESTWQYPTHRAAIARQFTVLARVHSQQRRQSDATKYLELARSTAPKVHAIRAFIELEYMNQKITNFNTSNTNSQMVYRDLFADLKKSYGRAIFEVEGHLGSHHPLLVCIHQEVANLFASLAQNSPAVLTESLQARQKALADSTKALGRIHKWTRAQVLKIGDINKNMGNLDDALHFYQDAFKSAQQCGAGPLVLGEICLAISGCQQERGDLDEALASAKRARVLLEDNTNASSPKEFSNNSTKSETVVNHFSTLNETLERSYSVIADLAQKIYEDVKEDSTAVLSEDIQLHLNLAVECYERLFDGIRQKPEIDGSKLLSVLKRIISLKLRLARPSQKILLNAIKSRRINASQSFVSECIMRIVASPSASSYMDRNLDKFEKPSIAAALSSGLNSSGEAKELFDEISCLLQIIES